MTDTPEKILYTAVATSKGGRDGHVTSDDGVVDLQLTRPGQGGGTNPEQLFAAGWSSCFASALGSIAKREGVDASAATVTARIGLGPQGSGFALSSELDVTIPGVELDQVQHLADLAHEVCPYSKATRGNVPVTIKAVSA